MTLFRPKEAPEMAGELPPEAGRALLPQTGPAVGEREIAEAIDTLKRYKNGKANLEKRIVDDELWWELRHWESMRGKRSKEDKRPQPTSAWLFNSILNKHADMMDNYPEPLVLPRERSDEKSAKTLSSVLPVIMEQNGHEAQYNLAAWEKLKHGTSAYGVFWDPEKENGLGDIDVKGLDLLKLFWEPGVTDIQKSRNLFIVDLMDEELLEQQFPEHRGRLGGKTVDVAPYLYDDTVDTSDKSVVVDWYYKRRNPSGKVVLHYVKFVGDVLLYASENDPKYRDVGWYAHGKYPVVLDVLFPEKGTPVGFGYVAICKDPQMYIDQLSANILENAALTTRKRFFVSSQTGVNEQEFLDVSKPLVHVEGSLDETRIREIKTEPLDSIYLNVVQMKIEEMKDTAANRDVSSGGAPSGVTAAAAIAALQEAGNKVSRDILSETYRAHGEIYSLCVELIRQFYDEARSFRITGEKPGTYDFVDISNAGLRDQLIPPAYPAQVAEPGYVPLYRRPIFDIKISAQKKNPFSRMEQNARAQELYQMGFFNPDRAQESLSALEMMDFEGIDKVKEMVNEGNTLYNVVKDLSAQLMQTKQMLAAMTGAVPAAGMAPAGKDDAGKTGGKKSAASAPDIQQGRENALNRYGQNLVARSKPNMQAKSNAAMPGR